jgi:broad specificity phosphatase PhoE
LADDGSGGGRVLILVRHAHAGDKRLWPFGDVDRPISARGQEQALGLARQLGELPVQRLVTSPYRRCRETLIPIADLLLLEPTDEPLLAPDADPVATESLLLSPSAEGALFCTHGELLNGLLRRWRESGLVGLPEEPETTPKGGSWILEQGRGRWVGHYLKPLRVVAVDARAAAQ